MDDVVIADDADRPELEIALEADAPIHGRVTAENGLPLPEARVTVEGRSRGRRAGQGHATADDDGLYELRGLAPGPFTLTFQAQGFVTAKRTADTRETNRLDVTLRRGLSLRGEVVRAGAGVPDATVYANSSQPDATDQRTQTDQRGRFTLEGLSPGRYTVSARVHGQGEAEVEVVDVEEAGPLRLVLKDKPTAVLKGKVIGLPQPGDPGFAMVTAAGEDGESSEAMVDGSHAFRMENAPAGRVTVRAHLGTMDGAQRTSRAVELTLAPGSETETVLEFSDDVVITGVVTCDGGPVPHVLVTFQGLSEEGSAGRTDARGVYQVVGLEPGLHKVQVSGDNVSFGTEHIVTGSGEFDIDITGGAVSGRVIGADGGAPIPGVEVSLFQIGGRENSPDESTATNSQGAFSKRSLRERRYRLITSKDGFGQEVREVEVARGTTAEVLLELTPADGISVTVVDARDGRTLEAIVVVRDTARRIVANRHSGVGEDGVFNIPLANGSYLLSTSATGFGTVTRRVSAPAQGLSIGLTPSGTLAIESSRNLRGRVRLVQSDGEEYVRCLCNGIADIELNGRRTTVENVTPGSYTVELVDAPEGTTPRPVVIRERQLSTVAIE